MENKRIRILHKYILLFQHKNLHYKKIKQTFLTYATIKNTYLC